MSGRIIVLGATGYAGRLAVDSLLRQGARPVLAGRRGPALPALAAELGGLEYRFADVTDVESVRALVGRGDVLVTSVGPFEQFGHAAAAAAAESGAHYVDCTGEVGFVRELRATYGAAARDSGSVMLPAYGYDYVPGLLAAVQAVEDAGERATAVEIGYFTTPGINPSTGLSEGTRKTVAAGLTRPVTTWRDSALTDERAARRARRFSIAGRTRTGILATGTEVLLLPERYPQLESVEVYNGWFSGLTPIVRGTSVVANAIAAAPAGRSLVDRVAGMVTGPAGGPDAVERARTRTQAIAVARDRAGNQRARVCVEGPSIYTLTGELMAWAARQLADGRGLQPGVVGPLEAFGRDDFVAGCREVDLTRIN